MSRSVLSSFDQSVCATSYLSAFDFAPFLIRSHPLQLPAAVAAGRETIVCCDPEGPDTSLSRNQVLKATIINVFKP